MSGAEWVAGAPTGDRAFPWRAEDDPRRYRWRKDDQRDQWIREFEQDRIDSRFLSAEQENTTMATNSFSPAPSQVFNENRIPHTPQSVVRIRMWGARIFARMEDVRSVGGAGPFTIEEGASVDFPAGRRLDERGLLQAAVEVRDRWGSNVGKRRFDLPPSAFVNENPTALEIQAARVLHFQGANPLGGAGSDATPTPKDAVPRKLGEKPMDTGEQEFIAVDDPRVQWIWEDLATYATGQHWCPQYDTLAQALGIPGRKREFATETTFGGARLTGHMLARSQEEADALFRKETIAALREALKEDDE